MEYPEYLAYQKRSAVIAKFDEDSYYSSQTGISNCDDFLWQGSVEQLLSLARQHADVSLPGRTMFKEDQEYNDWCCLYDGIST